MRAVATVCVVDLHKLLLPVRNEDPSRHYPSARRSTRNGANRRTYHKQKPRTNNYRRYIADQHAYE